MRRRSRTDPHSPAPARAEPAATPNEAPTRAARLGALIPDRALDPGEIVILMRKPSPWAILLDAWQGIAVIVALVAVLFLLRARGFIEPTSRELLVLGIGLAAVRLFWQLLDWTGRNYVLTDRRVLRVSGVARLDVCEIPLAKIRHAAVGQRAVERVLGIGTLAFRTCDHQRLQGHWARLARPHEVQQYVHQAIRRYH